MYVMESLRALAVLRTRGRRFRFEQGTPLMEMELNEGRREGEKRGGGGGERSFGGEGGSFVLGWGWAC